MTTHYSDTRKIHPGQIHPGKIHPDRGDVLGDQTPNDSNRVEIGPSLLALREWDAAGLVQPDLPRMRAFRWNRLTQHVVARGWGGILLFDPLNIRYATDVTNMQLWNTHNPFRAVLLCADGHMVLWEYKNARFLAGYNPLIHEVRAGGAGFFYFGMGDGCEDGAAEFAKQVRDLVAQHGGGNMRLGVDKIMLHGADALRA
ncbi:MAG: aminopeptidase P family protein, partial [Primorskyibacter sp.]